MIISESAPAAPSLAVALVGFCGVLVGAFLTAGTNYLLAVRKERAERKQRDETRSADFRQIRRLLSHDLLLVHLHLEDCVSKKRWAPTRFIGKAMDGWEKYHPAVAKEVSDELWEELSSTYLIVGLASRYNDEAEKRDGLDLDEKDVERFDGYRGTVAKAKGLLESHTLVILTP